MQKITKILNSGNIKNRLLIFLYKNNIFDQFLNISESLIPKLFITQIKKYYIYLHLYFGNRNFGNNIIIPIINIKRLENAHFEYEDKVNALNDLNKDREEKFNF